MKPKSTDAQAQRRKSAIQSAMISTFFRLLSVWALLWLRDGRDPNSLIAKLFLILVVLDLGSILPIWISLRARLKEIQGGEEDAAAQY